MAKEPKPPKPPKPPSKVILELYITDDLVSIQEYRLEKVKPK